MRRSAGKNIKTLGPVLWRKAGAELPVRIIVIRPLGYRLAKGSRPLYRQPAYLLCSDPELPLAELLQYYLWRWGIEVNFREEKTLIGTGEAQVRRAAATQHLPAMSVASYALLWVAALQLHERGQSQRAVPPPKWRVQARGDPAALPTTGEPIRQMRYEAWAGALRPGTFSHFMHATRASKRSEKLAPSLPSVLFCAA